MAARFGALIHSGRRPVSVGMKTTGLLLTVFALAFAGCGGGGENSSSQATPATSSGSAAPPHGGAGDVTIKDYKYGPPSLTVAVGATVKFTNQDSTPHTATSKEPGGFESGPIDTGKSATIKLDKPGTFTYYCVFHPFMKGTITVK